MADPRPPLPFFQQRLVFFALLFGMTMAAVVVGVVLQGNAGKGLAAAPIDELDTVVVAVDAALAIAAFVVRARLHGTADATEGSEQSYARFRATLVPLAMLESGCLLGLITWLLNGRTIPGLVAALVMLSLAIAIVPLRDPDEGR